MTDNPIDWAALMPAVASALLGEPDKRHGADWCYGRRGSLSVDTDKGVWSDFENQQGGGTLALILRELQTDDAGAFRWLEDNGLVERHRPIQARRPSPRPSSAKQPSLEPAPPARNDADESRQVGFARAIWQACKPAPGTPVMTYLHRRGLWPVVLDESGCIAWLDVFPSGSVGWIDRAALHRVDPALDADCPSAAVGAMVFAYRPVGQPDGPVSAVSLEALGSDGRRTGEGGRWRRSRGRVKGAVAVLPIPFGDKIALVEGEADGLAVVVQAIFEMRGLAVVGEVRVVGGASGMVPEKAADTAGRAVLLLSDGPGPDGRGTAVRAATACAASLRAAGRSAALRLRYAGDVADDLALAVHRRKRKLEDAGCGPDESEQRAWLWVLSAGERDD